MNAELLKLAGVDMFLHRVGGQTQYGCPSGEDFNNGPEVHRQFNVHRDDEGCLGFEVYTREYQEDGESMFKISDEVRIVLTKRQVEVLRGYLNEL